MADLFDTVYNPDVLTCIANLSNDEVFTPPELANQVLDMLPGEIWSNPNIKILDPFCKSGVFLREAAKRFIKGLEPVYPDLQERVDHIMHEQLYGIAITELTSLLSRRSLYCSKFADGKFSISHFDKSEGNIRFRHMQHTWVRGKCSYCGANEEEYRRDASLESHAYELIHTPSPERIFNMKFDVIVGNPPYQLSDGGGGLGSSAIPIYHNFVTQAIKLSPRYLLMIIPARWQSGGRGLDSFRSQMLSDKRIQKMVTYADSRDCFNGVDIAGGVCYFLWSRDYLGGCLTVMDENGSRTTEERFLDEFPVFIPSNNAVRIVRKITKSHNLFYDKKVSTQRPFGIRSTFDDKKKGDLTLRWRGGRTLWPSKDVSAGQDMIEKWKVIISKSSAEHAGQSDKNGLRKILTVIEMLEPGEICSETYLVVDAFDSKELAENLAAYLRTKFVRYLIWQATPTQNISKGCFAFVPDIDLPTRPTDEFLYDMFDLSHEDRTEIESKIKPIVVKSEKFCE